jgi:hypothetical protein
MCKDPNWPNHRIKEENKYMIFLGYVTPKVEDANLVTLHCTEISKSSGKFFTSLF